MNDELETELAGRSDYVCEDCGTSTWVENGIAIKHNNICPNCGSESQVWINQITKRLTCHRWGCNNFELK